MVRRTVAPLIALALSISLAMSSCGADDEPRPTDSATSSPSPQEATSPTEADTGPSPSEAPPTDTGTRIEVTRKNGKFTPDGDRLQAKLGEPIILAITADQPGELHVHSTPEQQVSYGPGTSEHKISIDQPGVVEVESHEPALVVMQLEVR